MFPLQAASRLLMNDAVSILPGYINSIPRTLKMPGQLHGHQSQSTLRSAVHDYVGSVLFHRYTSYSSFGR
jgi:hypothetical protein